MKNVDKKILWTENYLQENGFVFACSEEMDEIAQILCTRRVLQPVENLITPVNYHGKSHFYVRAILKTKKELPVSIWNHLVEGVGC